VTAAVEGGAYSYTLAATDPGGGTVSFTLTTAPAGATLSGNTVTWTPTVAESRVANSFTVTATTGYGGTAIQSWAVTPNGTITVNWVNTYWGPAGTTNVPYFLPSGASVEALVPQADGSVDVLFGAIGSDGVSTISNVPGGYFWLNLGGHMYWTSSSSFDMGTDYIGVPTSLSSGSTATTTTLNFNLSGLDDTASLSQLQFVTYPSIGFGGGVEGSTTFSGGFGGGTDLSQIHSMYILQDDPALLGPIQGFVLGPSLILSNLSLTNGATNNINGTLVPSPQASLPLKINGSAWTALFANAAPTTPTPASSPFSLVVKPFVSDRNAIVAASSPLGSSGQLGLFWPDTIPSQTSTSTTSTEIFLPAGLGCQSGLATIISNVPLTIAMPPLISTDIDFGTVSYGDPFPAAWQRVFSFCQQATVALPSLASGQVNYTLTNQQSTTLPTGAVTPLISPVVSPAINGRSLFTESTVNTRAVSLSWSKPATGTPFGYNVLIIQPETLSAGASTINQYVSSSLSTAQTSLTVPPELLVAGRTYWFAITALMDAKANMETSPNRSALPTGSADVISAPITISASAP
jgi:hypothetical protein